METRELLYKRVYEVLKQEIEDGVFQPGDRLPTEQELMERFGVSRVTTNRALKMLTGKDLVVRRAGAGTFVSGDDSLVSKFPLVNAQSRASKGLIGFVIPDVGAGYGVRLVVTAQRILQENGMALALACSYGEQSIEREVIERLVSSGVDGLLIFPSDGDYYNDTILRLYIERLPMVIIDKQMPGMPLPYVISDNVAGAVCLTRHLLDLGHTHIAFISTPITGTSSLQKRSEGYGQAIREAGLTINPEYGLDSIQFSDTDEEYDEIQIQRIADYLHGHPEVTAVFAARYKIAEHVYVAVTRIGKRVPEDVSIACFDGPPLKPYHWQFTHIRQDEKSIASEAVRLLTNLLGGTQRKSLNNKGALIQPTLVTGNTTSPPLRWQVSAKGV